jgi:type IV pilus assembly protein PilV
MNTNSRIRMTLRERGVSMVEALVALVVLSIGMLGIASLYVASLQAGRTALLRTQAITLVNDMVDRIRSNSVARDAYDLAAYGGEPSEQGCVAGEDNCSFTALAEDDLARWLVAVDDALPAPTGEVTVDPADVPTSPDVYVVTVSWREPGDPTDLRYSSTLSMIPVTLP